MKKALLPALILLSLLLSACGDGAAKGRFESFSASLGERESLSFTAGLRAEYPDRSDDFTLAYAKDPAGEQITVLAPELIKGISARRETGSTALVYEGLILDLGPLDTYGLTPMCALPRLVETMTGGHVDSYWEEGGLHIYRLILDDHLSATVWFDPGMRPLRAELTCDGNVRVFCEISDWS